MSTTYKKSSVNLEHAKFVTNRKMVLIDATNLVVGRLAAHIAQILIGKNKLNFSQGVDCGDRVILINANKMKFTSNKFKTKKYYRHTGFVGGLKESTPSELFAKNKSDEVIEHAVKGMLPKNRLQDVMMKNLRVFHGPTHDFKGQISEVIDIAAKS